MDKYYVYAHITKDAGEIFYIGKGSGKRIDKHYKRNDYWKRIVAKHGYLKVKLAKDLPEEDAFRKEIEYINLYKKKGLCRANISLGGDGVRVEKRWWGENISKAMKGKNKRQGKESFSYKDFVSREDLERMYIVEKKNTIQIAECLGVSIPTVCSRLKEYSLQKRGAGREKIRVRCINDNTVFNSITEAAKYYGVYRENIKKVLDGKYKKTGKLTFKYENTK